MSTAFVSVPLFQGISDQGLLGLGDVFEPLEVDVHHVLFRAGDEADKLYLLVRGRVALKEEGEDTIDLHPVSLIGELGAMVGLKRRLTAVTLTPSKFLVARGDDLRAFFERHAEVAVQFYQNLLSISADKINRDERRVTNMRKNIIKTQKALKTVRDLILDSPANDLSEPVHDIVNDLIAQNRRANYLVEPPSALPAMVRCGTASTFSVRALSRSVIYLPDTAAESGPWQGVLVLPHHEIPVTGTASPLGPGMVQVELDLLIEEYSESLENYLTQAQLLDVVL